MKIEADKWVAIHYTLTDDDGKVIDSSVGMEPLGYVHGRNYLIPGLERELEGKEPGAKFTAKIAPADGYGEVNPALIADVPRSQFETSVEITVGMQFQAMTPMGPTIVRVIDVNNDSIKIDGNHELAGKNLNFEVEVVEVRDATEDELNPTSGCGGGCGGCGGDCGGNCGEGDCNCGDGNEGGCSCNGGCGK